MRRSKIKGLSMIEVLVVMMIMGILVALILPRYMQDQFRLQMKGCEASELRLAMYIIIYRQQNPARTYPPALKDLITRKFMTKIPTCPSNKKEYSYITNQWLNNFTVYCNGIHYKQIPGVKRYNPYLDPLKLSNTKNQKTPVNQKIPTTQKTPVKQEAPAKQEKTVTPTKTK